MRIWSNLTPLNPKQTQAFRVLIITLNPFIMKKLFCTLTLFLLVTTIYGQAPGITWAKALGADGDDRGNKITLDPAGNVIMTGRFHSKRLMFDTISLVNAGQDSSTADVFLAKMSPAGQVLWARRFGGQRDELGLHVATDKDGNIVLVGYYESELFIVGDNRFTNHTEKGKGGDIFMIKLSPRGEILWSKRFGGEKHDGGYETCTIDKKGNIYYAGSFYSRELQIDAVTLVNSGKGSETFVAKFSPDGQVLWAKSAQGFDDDTMPQSSSLDSRGNFVIAGYFTGESMIFGGDTLKGPDGKLFIASFGPDGKQAWVKGYAGNIGSIAAGPSGDILFSGVFCDSLITMGRDTLINKGGCDIFITKLNGRGEVLWARRAGGAAMDGVRNFCVDKKGNSILTGSFNSPVLAFDAIEVKSIGEFENIFIAAYSPEGKALWARSAGGKGRNAGRACISDKHGNVYFTGSFEEPSLAFDNMILKNAGGADIFVVKLSQ
jgi:hypothetical protein